jgi:hypothetical protein
MRVEALTRRPHALLAAVLLVALFTGLSIAAGSRPAPARASSGGPLVPIIFPLETRLAWSDTFGAPRSGGRTHEGNDIMCPKMTPVLAVVDGTLDFMNMTLRLSSYNGQPYFNILLRGDDGNDYFYIHLNNDTPGTDDGQGGLRYAYAPGLTNGSRVEQGQLLGWAGDSGNAEDTGSHLHFEVHLGGYKNPVNPYNTLKAAPTWAEMQASRGSTTTLPVATTSSSATTSSLPPTTTTLPPTTTTLPPTTTTLAPTTTTAPARVPFADVTPGDWYYEELAELYEAGIVKGSDRGSFDAYSDITRAQFAALLVRALFAAEVHPSPDSPDFTDVPAGHWAYREVKLAAQHALVRGVGDGAAFAPERLISRAQMAAMVHRALESRLGEGPPDQEGERQRRFSDVPGDHWAAAEISETAALGLIAGADGVFRPQDNSKRVHGVVVLARLLRLLDAEDS